MPPLGARLFGDILAHSALDFADPTLSLPIRLGHARTRPTYLHTKQLTTIFERALEFQPCIYTDEARYTKTRNKLLGKPLSDLQTFLGSQSYELDPFAEAIHHYKDMAFRKRSTGRHVSK